MVEASTSLLVAEQSGAAIQAVSSEPVRATMRVAGWPSKRTLSTSSSVSPSASLAHAAA